MPPDVSPSRLTPDATASRDLPSRARVVIIGGGVIGASIAYHLAHLGWTDVVVVEQHALTAGTTWHAAGLITVAGMTNPTSLYFFQRSRELCQTLEEETGHSTGWKEVGHIGVAANAQRREALRREAAWMGGHGIDYVELSPKELSDIWPLMRTDDLVSGFLTPSDGRADPVGVTVALAKGARQLGARIVEGVRVTGVDTDGRRVTGVQTDHGRIETEIVVNAAGMWARQLGEQSGVAIPLQAAEHYYLITDAVPGMDADLAVVEDGDRYGYYRPEGDGMMVGLFEPRGAGWSVDRVPETFAFGTIPPDWERMTPFLADALDRVPILENVGVRTFFCGPESFTPDLHPMMGPAPELDGYFVAAGMNSLGILSSGGVGSVMASWIVDGVPPVDVAGFAVDRAALHETTPRFRSERVVEQLGASFGDSWYPTWKQHTARNIRRSALHERHVAHGAHFNASVGWEFPEWFDEPGHPVQIVPGFDRQASFPIVGREHRTVREGVGILDMSLMAKFRVQGPDAAAVLSRLSANDVTREVGRLVYTQWLNRVGGIEADLTVTRLSEDDFLVVASDLIHRRVAPMIRRECRDEETVVVTDVTSGYTLLTVQGPRSRELLARLTEADLSNDAFPYLTSRPIHVDYAPVLASRVTYVGELGWELYVPTEYGLGTYDRLLEVGADLGVRPVGMAAMSGLRLEKGYRDMGIDIDNTDNPLEAGLGFAVAWDKPGGFVGRDALLDFRAQGPPRKRVVSVRLTGPEPDLYGNEPVLADGAWVGYVRAAAFGHTVGSAVGLAEVENADGVSLEWLRDQGFTIRTSAGDLPAVVQTQPFYDARRLRILDEAPESP
jgi:glycine cleavage system aminomethyltransferase T/glycine/D-amino acid oxidase-like deaminating enzyme